MQSSVLISKLLPFNLEMADITFCGPDHLAYAISGMVKKAGSCIEPDHLDIL